MFFKQSALVLMTLTLLAISARAEESPKAAKEIAFNKCFDQIDALYTATKGSRPYLRNGSSVAFGPVGPAELGSDSNSRNAMNVYNPSGRVLVDGMSCSMDKSDTLTAIDMALRSLGPLIVMSPKAVKYLNSSFQPKFEEAIATCAEFNPKIGDAKELLLDAVFGEAAKKSSGKTVTKKRAGTK